MKQLDIHREESQEEELGGTAQVLEDVAVIKGGCRIQTVSSLVAQNTEVS